MCELPNDAARRKALDALPPSLNATYERILRRVNQSNVEVQKLVRRVLQWLVHIDLSDMGVIAALREALSIEAGDRRRNVEAIPDERDVLRWCSSLVRKSTNGVFLELAHFTVEEFLWEIHYSDNDELAAYGVHEDHDSLELAQICLTYLTFEEYDQGSALNVETTYARFEEYPFRRLAVNSWPRLARAHLCEVQLLPFLENLFKPSKSNNLVSWANDRISYWELEISHSESELQTIYSWVAEANPLHFAAVEGLPNLCSRLIELGCDAHRTSAFGTPLHCAVLGWRGWLSICPKSERYMEPESKPASIHRVDTVKSLLKAGADPNALCDTPTGSMSPLSMAIRRQRMSLILQLLQEGGLLDDASLDYIEREQCWGYQDLVNITQHLINHNAPKDYCERLTRLALRVRDPVSTAMDCKSLHLGQTGLFQKVPSESALRFAAEFGQLQTVEDFLKNDKLEIDSRQKHTGLTALHYAVGNDHIQVAKALIKQGANPCQPDSSGRTAIHHSVNGRGGDCLSFLLQQTSQIAATDFEGLNILHLAAQGANQWTLNIVLRHMGLDLDPNAQSLQGETALMFAARAGNTAAVELLLFHGCDPTIIDNRRWTVAHYATWYGHQNVFTALRDSRVNWDGKTSAKINTQIHQDVTVLHIAASHESCIALEYLLSEGLVSDINVLSEHSRTALFIAARSRRANNVSLLLSYGADPTIMDALGECPLHFAARLGLQAIALIFFDHGCDVALLNGSGLSPELLARKHGNDTLANEIRARAHEQGSSNKFP